MADTWLNVDEVAAQLFLSKVTVYRLLHDGGIPSYRFGRAYRVKLADLEAYIERSRVEVTM